MLKYSDKIFHLVLKKVNSFRLGIPRDWKLLGEQCSRTVYSDKSVHQSYGLEKGEMEMKATVAR